MVAFRLLQLVFLAASGVALIDRRDASTVQIDLNNIYADTKNLTNWLLADYNGLQSWITPNLIAYIYLANVLQSCSKDAAASDPFTPTVSSNFCDFLSGTYVPVAQNLINAFVISKPKYLVANSTSTGLTQLQYLKSRTDDCIGNITLKVTASAKPSCSKAQASLDQMYTNTFPLYNTTTCN